MANAAEYSTSRPFASSSAAPARSFAAAAFPKSAKGLADDIPGQVQKTASALYCVRAKKKQFVRLQTGTFSRFVLLYGGAVLPKER